MNSAREGSPGWKTGDEMLTKLHGLGNDFLVLLGEGGSPQLARRACDRHRGIGADGLIMGRRLSGDPVLSFTLWNADGSEAEMSGNGMRCLAHAALDACWVEEDQPFGVLTPAGRREVSVRRLDARTTWASVEMGPVKVKGEADRCNVGHGQLLVDVGNPHLVVLGRHPAVVDVAGLGAELSATDPAGLNVEFVALGPGPDEVTMRVWERGVGETQACGTGACAAAVAVHHWGRVGASVTVHQPGGAAAVSIHPDGTVTLTGPSERVAECELHI
ncbi:MAG: diaminopimelate epimerase [Acidimicrobiaceae bacterium]|nr:diaminopimelate epimerase [Acidimicrobiaceae bacterium]